MIPEVFLLDYGDQSADMLTLLTLVSKSNKNNKKVYINSYIPFFNNSMKLMSACRHVGIRKHLDYRQKLKDKDGA